MAQKSKNKKAAARQSGRARTSGITRRTKLVWATFIAAMAMVTGLLALADEGIATGFPALSMAAAEGAGAPDSIFRIEQNLDRSKWRAIVIHHSGQPAGDAESVHRRHLDYGLNGLGYHFLVGNGRGMGDGAVHVGYRWNRQLSGAHCIGPQSEHFNTHAIGICLIGNGERNVFTENQITQLTRLIRRLQAELGIPADRVYLHHDVAPTVSSPGQYFPLARLRANLLD